MTLETFFIEVYAELDVMLYDKNRLLAILVLGFEGRNINKNSYRNLILGHYFFHMKFGVSYTKKLRPFRPEFVCV